MRKEDRKFYFHYSVFSYREAPEGQIGATPVGPLVLSFTPADGGSLLYLYVVS